MLPACFLLSFFSGPARLASKGEFAPGQGFILLDDVACTGTESYLMDCPHSNWGQHDCSHEEDVGIRCSLVRNRITEDKTGKELKGNTPKLLFVATDVFVLSGDNGRSADLFFCLSSEQNGGMEFNFNIQ